MQPTQPKAKITPEAALAPKRLLQVAPGKAWSAQAPAPIMAAVPAKPSDVGHQSPMPIAAPTNNIAKPAETASAPGRKSWFRRLLPMLSFLLCVVGPSVAIGVFYFSYASPQYLVEVQFAVRGANSEAPNLTGFSALPGATGVAADSYIVQNYIRSQQLAKDIARDQDYDIRTAYSHDFIDDLNRIPVEYPFVDFEGYWQDKLHVEYNTISGNTTVRVFAFSPEEAKRIAEAVIVQSEKLVNTLSAASQQQLIGTAEEELARVEDKLRAARLAMQRFQNEEQILNPESLAQVELDIVGSLEGEMARLITRRRTLSGQIAEDSPVIHQLDQQIQAIQGQLAQQRSRIGSGGEEGSQQGSLADMSTAFLDLSITQDFAVNAYTTSLESLERAKAEAREHERYLATYIPPELPEVSRHPKPYLYTGIAILWSLFGWLVLMFLVRTIKDHAT